MRPKDLIYPFINEPRTILIKDRIWYVPGTSEISFTFPGWQEGTIFGNTQPISVEYCSGNGTWIASKALENPNVNWVGVEIKFNRVRKIWSKLKNLKLQNLIIICGEGFEVTQRFFPSNSISSVYINFPDPWPKRRHEKNRIVQSSFVGEITRCLKENGEITVVTDDEVFSKWTSKIMNREKCLNSFYKDQDFITDYPGYGSSYFDTLWREKGKIIRYHRYKKI